ncbi:DUF7117 family protein [Halomicrococcus sp. NG-SE-24]|uniref:DUF7117 family protein n=1 Tax=Halomicrococcus sp. NG-SE-24 TaxID=3436928 RepID=UPI003D96CEE3
MKVRGRRECKDCGTRWSYYETGTVECPDCGSVRSIGVDEERRQHTDSPADLDLTDVRNSVDGRPMREVAADAEESAREYVHKRGFIDGGDLRTLDDTYLAAQELRHAADVFGRSFDPTDDEELYFLSLLRGADVGDRPAPAEVPESMHDVRGLAVGDALREYHRDLTTWVDDRDVSRESRSALETLGEHVRRVRALEGGVDPETAESLVAAARELTRHLRDDDEDALVSARDRLRRVGE